MNYDQLRKSVGTHVRLVPPCVERGKDGARSIDDEWKVESADRENGVRLRNVRTEHSLHLNGDHVFKFTSALKSVDGVQRGFLELTVYVELIGAKTSIMPIATGPARVARTESGALSPTFSHILNEKAVGLMLQFIDTRSRVRVAIAAFQQDPFLVRFSGERQTIQDAVGDLRRITEQLYLVLPDLYAEASKQVEQLEGVAIQIRKNRYAGGHISMKNADAQHLLLQTKMQALIQDAREA